MANAGWNNTTRATDELHGTSHGRAGDGGANARNLSTPTSVGEQHTNRGYMRSEMPVGNDGTSTPVADRDGTGVPVGGYNVAAVDKMP